MRVLNESIKIASEVTKVLAKRGGRAADGGISLPFLLSMAAAAGDGDHVDIGSLYGASAIGVALIKKELNLEGDVYCIDPYDTDVRDKEIGGAGNDLQGDLSASEEALLANAEVFDVELKLVKEYSHPWPKQLEDNTFVSAYIDGDHKRNGPLNDFKNLRGRVTGYIGTDNFEEEYADVVSSIIYAMNTDEWFLWYKNLIFVALRKVLPMRSDNTYPQVQLAK